MSRAKRLNVVILAGLTACGFGCESSALGGAGGGAGGTGHGGGAALGTGGHGGASGGVGGQSGAGAGGAGAAGAGGSALAASLTIDPSMGEFGVTFGQPSDPIVFTVRNEGLVSSGPFTVEITDGAKAYKLTNNTCDPPLPPAQSCLISVVFDINGGAGTWTGAMTVSATGFSNGKIIVPLMGEAP